MTASAAAPPPGSGHLVSVDGDGDDEDGDGDDGDDDEEDEEEEGNVPEFNDGDGDNGLADAEYFAAGGDFLDAGVDSGAGAVDDQDGMEGMAEDDSSEQHQSGSGEPQGVAQEGTGGDVDM